MSGALDRVESEVGEMSTVVDSAVALINGLSAQIRDAAGDADKANALADQLDAKANALADAVAANTQAAEEPPAEPT